MIAAQAAGLVAQMSRCRTKSPFGRGQRKWPATSGPSLCSTKPLNKEEQRPALG
jgi:hypothetical protein